MCTEPTRADRDPTRGHVHAVDRLPRHGRRAPVFVTSTLALDQAARSTGTASRRPAPSRRMRRIELADVQHAHHASTPPATAGRCVRRLWPAARRAISRGNHVTLGVARPAELGGALRGPPARRACHAAGVVSRSRSSREDRLAHASIVRDRAIGRRRRRRPRAAPGCRSRPSACRTPAPRRSAGRSLRDRTAAARARCAGRPPPSVARSTNGSTTIASSTPRSRARTRCSAVNGPPTRISRTSGRAGRTRGEDVEQHVDPLARDRCCRRAAARRRAADPSSRAASTSAGGVGLWRSRPASVPFGITDSRSAGMPASAHQRAARRLAVARDVRGAAQTRRESGASSSGTAPSAAPLAARGPSGTCRGHDR